MPPHRWKFKRQGCLGLRQVLRVSSTGSADRLCYPPYVLKSRQLFDMADITATTRKRKVTEVAQQPKAGMTVQEYLMGEKTKMVEAIQAHIHSQINKLRNEFELGKIELEQEVERQIAELEKQNEAESSELPKKKAKTDSKSQSSSDSTKIQVMVVEGVHKDALFKFKRTSRLTVMIGRSTGKRFKRSGVSLFKDSEVSTTHGKIHVHKDDLCYSDLGSTNGSFLNGEALAARKTYVINDGDVLRLGQSHLKVSIQ